MNHVVYDAKASVFFTLVPEQARQKTDGTKDYRLVAFGVPGLVALKVMPAGSNLAEEPHIQPKWGKDETGQPKIVPASEWAPLSDLDLAAFTPGKAAGKKSDSRRIGRKGSATFVHFE